MINTRLVRMAGWGMAGTFVAVGVIFVAIPGKVLAAFNWLAGGLSWPESTTEPYTLYLALAVAYMYLVTLLAWQMARHPEERVFPWVLAQTKAVSALFCIVLFALQEQYLLYLANFVVDGAIALFVWWLCLRPAAGRAAAKQSEGG